MKKFLKEKINLISREGTSHNLWLFPALAWAQKEVDYTTQEARCKKFASYFTILTDGLPQFCTLSQLLAFVLERLLWLSGSVAVLFVIIGGFFYLSAAGNEEQSEKGKKILMNSIVGLIIIVMATAIVRIVAGTLKGN